MMKLSSEWGGYEGEPRKKEKIEINVCSCNGEEN